MSLVRFAGHALVAVALALSHAGCLFGLTASVETDKYANSEREEQYTGFAIGGLAVGLVIAGGSLLYLAVTNPAAVAKGISEVGRQYAQENRRRRAENAAFDRRAKQTEERYRAKNPSYGGTPKPKRPDARPPAPRRGPTRTTPPITRPVPAHNPSPPVRAGWEGPKGGVDYGSPSTPTGSTETGATAGSSGSSGSSGGGSHGGSSSSGSSGGAGGARTGSGGSSQDTKLVLEDISLAFMPKRWSEFYYARETAEGMAKTITYLESTDQCRQVHDAISSKKNLNYGPVRCELGGSDGKKWRCQHPVPIATCQKWVRK